MGLCETERVARSFLLISLVSCPFLGSTADNVYVSCDVRFPFSLIRIPWSSTQYRLLNRVHGLQERESLTDT